MYSFLFYFLLAASPLASSGFAAIGDWNFFGLKASRDQDGANKKRFSQIGPAVPELLRHTRRQTDKNPYYFVVLI